MDKEAIGTLFDKYLKIAIPEFEGKEISRDETFEVLGVNSLDRVDVISMVLDDLSLQVSQIELFDLNSISALSAFLESELKVGQR